MLIPESIKVHKYAGKIIRGCVIKDTGGRLDERYTAEVFEGPEQQEPLSVNWAMSPSQ